MRKRGPATAWQVIPLVWLVAAMPLLAQTVVIDSGVTVRVAPARPWVERREGQRLNFDLVVENLTRDTLRLTSIVATVYDGNGNLEMRRLLESNGSAPAIDVVIPDGFVAPRGRSILFNPFFDFDSTVELSRLHYNLEFSRGENVPRLRAGVDVRPRPGRPTVSLQLPLRGRVFVFTGHDFLSHHRRFNFEHPIAQRSKLLANFMRYGYDLVPVNDRGEMYRGSGERREDFYGWDVPVYAPAGGTVVAAFGGQLDNVRFKQNFFDPSKLPENPLSFYGNYVIIDHGDGNYSLLGHVKAGSVVVRAGDRVSRGQVVAHLGASGSAEDLPHLHYELRDGPTQSAEGIPSYFHDFVRLLGARRLSVSVGQIDTGDFVESMGRPTNSRR